MPLLAWKLLLAPSLVASVSLLGRVLGPRVSGFLTGLPIVVAPIMALLLVEQGPAFTARAALGCAMGVISLIAFCLVFAHASRAWPWPLCLLSGWFAFACVTGPVGTLPFDALVATLAPTTAVLLGLRLLPHVAQAAPKRAAPSWDVPVRMAATACMVLAVTWLADVLGPSWSGLVSPFPVATSVLAAFAHAQLGRAAAVELLRGLLFGLFAFLTFCVGLALALPRWPALTAFVVALVACVAVHTTTWLLLSMRSVGAREVA